MRARLVTVMLVIGLLGSAGGSVTPPTDTQSGQPPSFSIIRMADPKTGAMVQVVDRQVAVRFAPNITRPMVEQTAQRFGARVLKVIPELNAYLIEIPSSETIAHAMDFISQQPGALFSEPNYIVRSKITTPNDPYFLNQWPLNMIYAPDAWDFTRGSPSVTVAFIDSGADLTHADLVGQWASWGNDIVDFKDDSQGPNDGIPGPDNDPTDSTAEGHGTSVAGIIAARSNNNLGVAGVAWDIKLLPLRYGELSFSVAEALVYAGNRSDVKVVNMSIGSCVADSINEAATDYAYMRGKLLIASAGNEGQSTQGTNCEGFPPNVIEYPAGYPHVMAVAAVDESGNRSSYTQHGNWITISAPGSEGSIWTTDLSGAAGYSPGDGTPNPDYTSTFSGTSAAAPYVAGVAALVFSLHPDWSPDQVLGLLFQTANAPPGWDNSDMGAGIVNAYSAITTAVVGDGTRPFVVGAEALYPNRVNVFFSEPMDATTAQTASNYTITGGSGLTVYGAVLLQNQTTVQLTTSPQTGGTNYTVTGSTLIADNHGLGMFPDPSLRSADFAGTNQDENIASQANGGISAATLGVVDPRDPSVVDCLPDASSPFANDGNTSTAWTKQVGNPNDPAFLMVRFNDIFLVQKIVVRTDPGYSLGYEVHAGFALCGVNENIVAPDAVRTGTQVFTLNPPVTAREVLLNFSSAQGSATGTAKVTELEVYAEKAFPETNLPSATITSPSAGQFLRAAITVSGTATDDTGVAKATFLVDGAPLCSNLTTPPFQCAWNTTTSTDGAHALTLQATDVFDNVGTSPPVSVTVDNTPPDTTILTGPPAQTGLNSATFTFQSSEPNSTFQCKLDSGAYAACTSPKVYAGLATGNHTFSVFATDPAGNTDATPATQSWTVTTGSFTMAKGANSPPASTTASKGQTDRPMLQLNFTSGPLEDVHATQLRLTAGGDGNDASDIAQVKLWLDANGNGQKDAGDTLLGNSVYSADNGTATLAVNRTVAKGASEKWLVTYDIGATIARAPGISGHGRGWPALLFAIPLLLLSLSLGVSRRAMRLVTLLVLVASVLFLTTCGGGGGGGPVAVIRQYIASLAAATDVTASGVDSGAAIQPTGAFPITGTTLSVQK